jgi:hypothetical protein
MTDFLTDQGYRTEAATTLDEFDAALDGQSSAVMVPVSGATLSRFGYCCQAFLIPTQTPDSSSDRSIQSRLRLPSIILLLE